MRVVCVLLVVTVMALLAPQGEAWRRFRLRRTLRRVGRIAKRVATGAAIKFAAGALIGRDVSSVDANNDGLIDHSEASEFTSEDMAARDLLEFVDENDDSVVTTDEFTRGLREIAMQEE